MKIRSIFPFASLLICLWQLINSSWAATTLDPPYITLSDRNPITTLAITNTRSVPAGYSIEVFGWHQQLDGEVQLSPTDSIRVEPTNLLLPPGGGGEVRIVALEPAPVSGEVERVYRIRVSELPDREREKSEEILQVIATFTLPVFHKPARLAPAGRLADIHFTSGSLRFTIHNDGTEHTYVREARVVGRDATDREVFSIQRQGWYVLPQGRLQFNAILSAKDCHRSQSILIEAHSLKDDAVWHDMITTDQALCGDHKISEFLYPGQELVSTGDESGPMPPTKQVVPLD